MSKSYTIRTIKDIFDQIPDEALDTFLREFAALVRQAKGLDRLFVACAGEGAAMKFPESIEWIDDSKGTITLNVVPPDGDEVLMTMESVLAPSQGKTQTGVTDK